MKLNEDTLMCVDLETVKEFSGGKTGFFPIAEEQAIDLNLDDINWLPRAEAETNENFKQLVVYCVIMHKDKYLCYRRKPKGGEERLKDLYSIGVGGHVEFQDALQALLQGRDAIMLAAERELNEEIVIEEMKETLSGDEIVEWSALGLINENDSPVGRVHLGFIYCWNLPMEVKMRQEDPDFSGEWSYLTLDELKVKYDSLERWSQILVDEFNDRH